MDERISANVAPPAIGVRQDPDAGRRGAFLGHSLTIGTIAGTKVRLHWTFVVYLAWIGIAGLLAGGASAAFGIVGLMAAVFACVLAHEFGHILTARRFGIPTPDVTLLPIGGVARLQRIPERPGQELAVAVAGPLVNLAIAAVLVGVFGVVPETAAKASLPTIRDILPSLATINLFLALFNLIPAFPMDGGRILRAALAAFTDHNRATRIAASIGQVLAIGFGLFGLISGSVILIFIAIFVYLAAGAEAQDVRLHRLARPMRVADAMMSEIYPLRDTFTLGEAAQALLRTGQHDFPVFDHGGRLVGLLDREQIVRGLRNHTATHTIAQLTDKDWQVVSAESSLEDALSLADEGRPIIVAGRDGRFAGLLTRANLRELLLLTEAPAQ